MVTLHERLTQLCKDKGIKGGRMCSELGISKSLMTDLKSGRKKGVNAETAQKIASYFGVSVGYLLGEDEKKPLEILARNRIPVIGTSAAGIPIEAVQQYIDDKDPDTWEEITDDLVRTGTFVAVRISGNSMEPRIFDGDIVIVRLQETAENGDTVIVFVNGDEATCKKIKKTPEGVMLMSNNPTYDPMFFTYKEVEQLPVRIYGKVVEVRGRL